jgi:two-component system, chemotaxis family, protein-glutamate methylesterase/glutaminase
MNYNVIVAEASLEFRLAIRSVVQKMPPFELYSNVIKEDDLYKRLNAKEGELLILGAEFGGGKGMSALKKAAELRNIPIIFISSDYSQTAAAYENGAALFLLRTHTGESMTMFEKRLKNALKLVLQSVKETSTKKTDRINSDISVEPKYSPDEILLSKPSEYAGKKIIAIGASTGGVDALTKVLTKLPLGLAPIVVVQHIPLVFSKNFVDRLNLLSKCSVVEAKDGDTLEDSTIYFAPGEAHFAVEKGKRGEYTAKIIDGVKISRHRPSVDILFRSVNNAAGGGAMAVMMTGMGDDGTIGIKELFDSGAYTIAQSEESSVVFGMAGSAIKAGGVRKVVDLEMIAVEITQFCLGVDHLKTGREK